MEPFNAHVCRIDEKCRERAGDCEGTEDQRQDAATIAH
jgi:hypothetical protein